MTTDFQKPRLADAIRALSPTSLFSCEGDKDITWYNDDGTIKNDNTITKKQLDAKLVELIAEYDVQAYARNRKREYDTLNQLELMTDDAENSTTSHATAIGVIKTKWPKDNSGPVE